MGRYISVPLTRYTHRRTEVLMQLEKLGADRVFLCTNRGLGSDEQRKEQLSLIIDGISFFKQQGYSVGIWLSSFGHGGNLVGASEMPRSAAFSNIVGVTGESAADSFCPLDESFAENFTSWITMLSGTDADMIMLDDDYRLSSRVGGFGCFCEKHMRLFSERLGETLSREKLAEKIFCGEKNKYREAYLDIEGETLRSFSEKLRAAVDGVNPDMRMGACACFSVWDGDGIDSIEIAYILAGKNKPFLRLIGAPYWATLPHGWGEFANKLGYIAEIERMQAHWCEKTGIETMSEGDVYPRPRYNVPSAYLEGFDTVLLSDGKTDGILKYAVDYTSSPTYENGYADRAERNKPLYDYLSAHFSSKPAVGIQVACQMKKLREREFSDTDIPLTQRADYSFFQPEQAFLCDNSLPACYSSGEVCVCFGENAKYIEPKSFSGLILDIPGARVLLERGIDTGLISFRPLSAAEKEYFPCEQEEAYLASCKGLIEAHLRSGANALSYFDSAFTLPSAYTYENSDGMRFYVLCADMDSARNNMWYRRSYSRQRQAIQAIGFLSQTALPAVCPECPDLYIMCKADNHSLSVGLWNFFADSIFNPEIILANTYESISFFNCSGSLDGNRVKLEGEIPAFGCAFFEMKNEGEYPGKRKRNA